MKKKNNIPGSEFPKVKLSHLGRIMGYTFRHYKVSCIVVLLCIIVQALCTMYGMIFIQSLIDDYIKPLIGVPDPDFSGLLSAIIRLAIIYVIGLAANYAHGRIMVNVTQGTLRCIRDDLFRNMQNLPIKYFDTHQHGDIMSVYTNDIDTFRQFISQSCPQMISSSITIVFAFVSMVTMNIPMTVMSVTMALVMLFVSTIIGGKSGKYFGRQQADLGKANGYIEEMLDGQKVVKVFCHEEKACEEFEKINEQLRDSADKANTYANIMMPINANIGNISYVLVSVLGAILAINGVGGLTLGIIIAFVGLNKN